MATFVTTNAMRSSSPDEHNSVDVTDNDVSPSILYIDGAGAVPDDTQHAMSAVDASGNTRRHLRRHRVAGGDQGTTSHDCAASYCAVLIVEHGPFM